MATVLITTSGTGSRLGSHTEHTNKSLLPVGDKYAICRIIELYPADTTFVITLGSKGDLVKDFLDLAYPKREFLFVWIDNYEGPGSSQVYSMLAARQHLNKPFMFHCCDTIVQDVVFPTKNTLFVANHTDFESYSSVNVVNGLVIGMNPKGTKDYDYVYTGLAFIQEYEAYWSVLDAAYRRDPMSSGLSDIIGYIGMMSNGCAFDARYVDKFYDTGNPRSYAEVCKNYVSEFDVLEKSYESLCFFPDRVIKFSSSRELNSKRYQRGLVLGSYRLTPKLLEFRPNFICMEFVPGKVLSKVYVHGEIYRLLQWASERLWTDYDVDERYVAACERFYKTKTMERLSMLHDSGIAYTINGLAVGTLSQIMQSVDFESLYTNTFWRFHGDFILENIIRKENGEFVLLDWRHEFDASTPFGDMYYDLAKLRHNIIFNFNNIKAGLFSYVENGGHVTLDLKCNYFLMQQLEDFDRFVLENEYDGKKIKVLCALIWLNMAPLYNGQLRRFLFYFGLYNLRLAQD